MDSREDLRAAPQPPRTAGRPSATPAPAPGRRGAVLADRPRAEEGPRVQPEGRRARDRRGPTRSPRRRTRARSGSRERSSSTIRSPSPRSSPTCGSTPRRSRRRCCTTPSRTPRSASTDIEEEFGDEVARIVDGLTKLDRLEFQTREQEQAENVRKMIVAMAGDIRVLLIKLADRLHNMRTSACSPRRSSGASPPRRSRSTRRSRIASVCRRSSGSSRICRSRPCTPGPYREIASLVDARRDERTALIEEVTSDARAKLKELGVKAEVEGRPKHLYSIYEKMVIRGKEFNEIYDLVGVRILVDSLRDCYARARRRARPLEADPRPLQGLRRDAQVEHVPVAAHDGRRAGWHAARDPDPHARHAPHRAVRHRCALAVQGGRQAGEGGRPRRRGSGR